MEFLIAPLDLIGEGIANIPKIILDGIKGLFVPSDTYFSSKFEELKNLLAVKLQYNQYISVLESIKNLLPGQMPNFTVTWRGHAYKIIDWSYLDSARSAYYYCIRGVFMFLLLKYNYNQIYRILRNTDLIGSSPNMQQVNIFAQNDNRQKKNGGE